MKRTIRNLTFAAALAGGLAAALPAATYLPLPDRDLAERAPLIVRARVLDRSVRLELINGAERPMNVTTFATLETLKGAAPDVFQVRLPGGAVGDFAWWVPGTPVFSIDSEVVLFLESREADGPRAFALT